MELPKFVIGVRKPIKNKTKGNLGVIWEKKESEYIQIEQPSNQCPIKVNFNGIAHDLSNGYLKEWNSQN